MTDKIRLGLALLFASAGIAGFYYLGGSAPVVRVASVLAGLLLAMGVAWFTEPGKRFAAFTQESVTETKKVVWPTRRETLQTTGVVFLFAVVMALFLWMVDAGLLLAVQMMMGRGE